jgi:dipeptidyl-peptidase-4
MLWRWTPDDGETLLADPIALLAGAGEELSAQERARRERAREAAGGIVAYTADRDVAVAVFALSGRLFFCDVATGETRELDVADLGSAVIDPRIDPTGQRVAFVSDERLWVIDVDGHGARPLSPAEDQESVTWGLADFISAEELDRSRGFWWSPEGDRLLVQRTDNSPVPTWYVSHPADPGVAPTPQRYPAAGSANPVVSLSLIDLDGDLTSVGLPADAEYVATVSWTRPEPPVVAVLDRPQQSITWLSVDIATGRCAVLRGVSNEQWVDVVPGSGCVTPDGKLVTVEVVDDDYALCVDGVRRSPPGLQVRSVIDVGDSDILVAGAPGAGDMQLWTVADTSANRVTPETGWHTGVRGGDTVVAASADLERVQPIVRATGASTSHEFESLAETPLIEPRVHVVPESKGRPRIAVLLPRDHHPGSGPLPVLMDPYGGPHHASVAHHQAAFRESQWFADQGFAVVVVDGRGTPGTPAWERGVHHDLAGPVLDDQIVGLHAAAHAHPDLDLERVAIRGWSFGGYLAALAVIDRPDVFHAAVVGAPVTDWRLYDTAYTERYLGVPSDDEPETLQPYNRSSLLERAASLTRPVQLIHGLADDNVFVAHALQLSRVLTENGCPHEMLPLSGITHMATQEDVAENLLLLQVDFLRRSLSITSP